MLNLNHVSKKEVKVLGKSSLITSSLLTMPVTKMFFINAMPLLAREYIVSRVLGISKNVIGGK